MGPETVFYDGNCGFCKRVVWRLILADAAGAFEYAPLGGERFNQLFPPKRQAALPDSVLVLRLGGEVLAHSTAVAHILVHLGGAWRVLGWLTFAFPRPLRDWGYHLVDRARPWLSKWTAPTDFARLPPDRRDRLRP